MLPNERQLLIEAFLPQIGMLVVDVLLNSKFINSGKVCKIKLDRGGNCPFF